MSMNISRYSRLISLTMDRFFSTNHATAQLLVGDCLERLKEVDDNSIDLIITSPPYANQRKSTYGGIHPDLYISWFLPRSSQLMRILKPTGTFILNIKEHARGGERHTYVIQLISALRSQGWLWTEEFIWHKKNPMPGKWPNRFKDAWERLLQFNLQKQFSMYQEAVMVPATESTKRKRKHLKPKDFIREFSRSGSGFNRIAAKCVMNDKVYPTNVLWMAGESQNIGHSAVFPKRLPAWFIRLFTKAGDMVLDPFMGSGTTCEAAMGLGRNVIGIDVKEEYVGMAYGRVVEEE